MGLQGATTKSLLTWRASPNKEGPDAASKYTCSGRAALRTIHKGWGLEALGKLTSLTDLGALGQGELDRWTDCLTAGLRLMQRPLQKQKHSREVLMPAELQTASLETRVSALVSGMHRALLCCFLVCFYVADVQARLL